MTTTIFRLLSFLLIILFAFILGVLFNLKPNLNVVERAKIVVADAMYQPQAVDFKNVKLYSPSASIGNTKVGNVCGEVFTFKDEAPYQYKKFIVEVEKDKQGNDILSFPLFDFEGEMIPVEDFERIWAERCTKEIPILEP